MKRLFALLVLLTVLVLPQQAMAACPYNATGGPWYWSVTDHSPGTQVWAGDFGAFVVLADGTYTAWQALGCVATTIDTLANLNLSINRLATANYKGGYQALNQAVAWSFTNPLPQFNYITTSQPNLVATLPLANVPTSVPLGQPIYIVNVGVYPFDLNNANNQFVAHVWPGDILLLWSTDYSVISGLVNSSNALNFAQPNTQAGTQALGGGDVTLSNPAQRFIPATAGAGPHKLNLPPANQANSYPIGYPIFVYNAGSNAFNLCDNGGNVLISVPVGATVVAALTDKSTANGTYFTFNTGTGPIVAAQMPALTGDTTTTIGTVATTTKGINGVDQTTAWTSYTPTLGCGSGSLTSASATGRSKTLGKTIFLEMTITITTNGTCGAFLSATLPVTANTTNLFSFAGQDTVSTKALTGSSFNAGTQLIAYLYDGTYPGVSGHIYVVSAAYEAN